MSKFPNYWTAPVPEIEGNTYYQSNPNVEQRLSTRCAELEEKVEELEKRYESARAVLMVTFFVSMLALLLAIENVLLPVLRKL